MMCQIFLDENNFSSFYFGRFLFSTWQHAITFTLCPTRCRTTQCCIALWRCAQRCGVGYGVVCRGLSYIKTISHSGVPEWLMLQFLPDFRVLFTLGSNISLLNHSEGPDSAKTTPDKQEKQEVLQPFRRSGFYFMITIFLVPE